MVVGKEDSVAPVAPVMPNVLNYISRSFFAPMSLALYFRHT